MVAIRRFNLRNGSPLFLAKGLKSSILSLQFRSEHETILAVVQSADGRFPGGNLSCRRHITIPGPFEYWANL